MISENSVFQILFYIVVLVLCMAPLGYYMSRVYEGEIKCQFIETFLYRVTSINPNEEMTWQGYTLAMLIFNILGGIVVYLVQIFQAYLPLNPEHLGNVSQCLALNTAISFITNTDWQPYNSEITMSYFTKMFALTVQNFISAATGMAILIAFIRGLVRHETSALGNFWVDMIRSTLYILLPLSVILAVILVSQGVIQNFQGPHVVTPLISAIHSQALPMGPIASQTAISQLGSNGNGYFSVNSAHPFVNPTPVSNFFEMLSLLLIPAALCYTFGRLIKDPRQGWALLITMLIIFGLMALITIFAEQHGNPLFTKLGIDQVLGNMEGKEVRFGAVNSGLWAAATTASSNGSINAALDSFTPIGGLIPLWLMQLGEVIFGGVGSGLYGMLIMVILTVFIAGLMVGRSPEYLGKKIEPYEMKLAACVILIMPVITLVSTALAVVTKTGVASLGNPGAHGFTEILYAFSSMANNNGSAFSGLSANTIFYNSVGDIVTFLGRYGIAIAVLAMAGALAKKKIIASGAGTLPTHTPLFVILLIAIIFIIGALTFLPALALGPIVEQIQMLGH